VSLDDFPRDPLLFGPSPVHRLEEQAEGWWLEQPEPGVLVWRTPAGRTYVTTPTGYPV
jgi:hypothetical protein